jgi:Tfp pilus assembly protein PilX
MKKRVLLMTSILALAALASARVALAQQKMIVDVPFAFVAGHATLPAGEYYIQSSSSDSVITLICRSDRSASAMVLSTAATKLAPATKSKLVFNRYGNRYFLAQFWSEGNRTGRELPKSAREKESAQIASLEPRGQVTVAVRLAQ